MASSAAFDEAYKKLNKEQKLAVDSIDGPVFVIAGPGTGKTQVLTLRVANILQKTDTPPDAILALTFTESAASNMRERLSAMIGGTTAWKVRMHTFHGFAESLISRYPDAFPRIVGGQVASDAERAEIIEAAILTSEVTHLRPYGDPLYYYRFVSGAIPTLKRENVTPEKLLERIIEAEADFEAIPDKFNTKGKYEGKMKGDFLTLQKKIEKTRDLLTVYKAYEAGLTARKRYDFDDLILEAVRGLTEDENLRLQVQESTQYVLADEHQDANAAQNALLELLTDYDARPNLFIVGDEKQAIYRFQGADLDNVHYFRERFTDTKIIALIENYRSTQSILDTALSLIVASPDERLSRAPLVAKSDAKARPISVVACETPEQEGAELATRIKALIEEGTKAEDIAVFGRTNSDVSFLVEELKKADIAVSAGGETSALRNRYVQALIRLLKAIAEPRDENLIGIMTLPAFPLSAADVWRVMQYAKKERMPVLSLMRSPEKLKEARLGDEAAALALGALIEQLVRVATIERPAVVAEEALRLSGILPRILGAPDRAESLAAIRALLRTLEDLSRREHDAMLARSLQILDLYEERNISLTGDVTEAPGKVKVMTVHKAKGREFLYTFIPRLTESSWSTRSRPEHFHLPDILSGSAELEDERRLLYVAITRAKNHATISYAATRSDGRADAPSTLLEDLTKELVQEEVSKATYEDPLLTERTPKREGNQPSKDDLETLKHAFISQGLSATALNNYLECPWKYFYVNLLRIPEAENKFMLYGTAVHAALHRYALERKKGIDIGAEGLISSFTHTLTRSPLSDAELKELQAKGERSLGLWWEDRHVSWPERTEAELAVEAKLKLTDGTEFTVKGKLDRIDETSNGASVVDYKTGKPRSRNELMGNTKEGDGNYYRQLVFYKLLLAHTETPRVMQDGIIEFVEPDEKGRIRTELFPISNEAMDELEALVKKSAEEILTLSFWNEPCNEVACPWCSIRFS
ncbi:MAG: UvrD/REP helicase, helicase / ATP-dependent helicase PcrA [Parcubacteria group bacterium]|nr:UvrD/REP helicase, helicase / ATP-dependent helicase PcrA [Parcubacteria group bacterium]